MSHNHAHVASSALAPERTTALRIALIAGVALLLSAAAAAAMALSGTNLAESTAVGLGLLSGPLIEGPIIDQGSPLIDLGGLLTDNQFGQFQ